MSNLNEQQLAHLRKILDDRHQALSEEVHREVNEQDDFADIASPLPDPGDQSFANLAVDLGNADITRDITELRAIEAAQGRMEEGSYGDCIDCGSEIPYARLEVQPIAERCMPCQEAYEKSHGDVMRRATL